MSNIASLDIKFDKNKDNTFYTTLKNRVDAYFAEKKLSKKANALMVFKVFFYLGIWSASYYFLMFVPLPIAAQYVLWAVLGFFSAFIGLNICHDAIHGSFSENRHINNLLSHTFYLIGANVYMWKITHNIVHHTYTNIDGHDEDITPVPIMRMSPHQPLKKIHKYQHIYVFFLYALASISWVFIKDYKKFFQKQIGGYPNDNHPTSEYFKLFGFKAVYYVMFVFVPFMFIEAHWGHILLGFLLMHWCEGYTLTFIFNLAHVVEGTEYPLPDESGNMENVWAEHQLRTTADFACENDVLNFFFGGLNFQVEHHLFPKVCHVHYKAISKIVKSTAEEYGLPYLAIPTFGGAINSHIKLLKHLGTTPQIIPA